ncbi:MULTISPECIES: urea transporter [unclassified Streptomyces]|uniref:urea transporter n=1 Tax=unclassified Streptomyces TaxID=2593676 RepID=UPI0003674FE5|nr:MULTISPECIES: urea transporter [unclassified Streptomyces]MYT29768.1 urea transporter [Streptomyces sp. SID8354]
MRQPGTAEEPAAKRHEVAASRRGRFVTEVLRGQAQVDFLPDALTGLVFSLALFAAGWRYGLYGLTGAAVGTGTARLLGVDRGRVAAGLEGFNSCLVGVACAVFLDAGRLSTLLVAVAASAVVTVVTAAAARVLGTWELPTLTLPFCLTATALTVAAPGFRHVWHRSGALAALPGTASGPTALGFTDLWHAFFADFGEIFLMPQWYVGLVFLAGIFLADRRLGALACAGSAVALLTSWALGAPANQVRQGLMGYDAVLVAMALGGVFLVTDAWSVGYAMVGAVASTVLGPALGALFAPSGGHAFTWPFVLVTLVFLAAVPAFPRLRRAAG